jgi:hypothetical protein
MAGGLHALAVQHCRRGLAVFVPCLPHQSAQRVVERGPLVVQRPAPENMIHGLPRGKVGWQIPPGTAAFDQIRDGVNQAPPVLERASELGGLGQYRFEIVPLGVGKISVVSGDFHRLRGASADEGRKNYHQIKHFIHLFAGHFPKTPQLSFSDSLLDQYSTG